MNTSEQAFFAEIALGTFSIDTTGRIWRHARLVGSRAGNPSVRRAVTKRTAETAESHGYRKVQFTAASGERMWAYSHRLVWIYANKATIPERMEINHRNGEPKDNRPENLELVTRQENTRHAAQVLGRLGKKEQRGEKNTSAKLTPEQVLEARALWEDRAMTMAEMGRRYGVNYRTIQDVVHRRSWSHLP